MAGTCAASTMCFRTDGITRTGPPILLLTCTPQPYMLQPPALCPTLASVAEWQPVILSYGKGPLTAMLPLGPDGGL